MIYKYAGMTILFFCCAYFGYCVTKNENKRLKNCDALIQFLKYIKVRIEYYRQPVNEIYAEFSNSVLEKSGFIDNVRKNGLKTAILQSKTDFGLDEFLYNSLLTFSQSLGNLPLDEQLVTCDYIIGLLEEKQKNAKKEYPQKKKLYNSLGILIGISVVIMLI